MKKKFWLILLLAITLILTAIGVDAYYFSSKRLHINYYTLSSLQIPNALDDVTIALLSDIEYGTFLQREQLESIQKKLENIQPDIILFSGDLFDENYLPTESDIIIVTNFLSSLEAKNGKFAVLGDFDYPIQETVEQVLYNSNFEIIENKVMRIRNQTQDYIYLVGLPSITQSTPDISTLFSDIPEESYVITLCHTPDVFSSLPIGQVDILMSGHSHGSQINIPVYGAYERRTGNETYNTGLQHIDGVRLYISKGIGTTKQSIRLFSDPEIPVFRLQSSN